MEQFKDFYKRNTDIRKIGIFCGKFRPPHKTHFFIAEIASEQNDQVFIIISPVEKEGISAKQSLAIWKLYATIIPNLKFSIAEVTPVRSAYELVDRINQDPLAPNTVINLYCDENDMDRYKNIDQYSTNLKALNKITTPRTTNASKIRTDLLKGNKAAVFRGLPKQVNREEIWNILTKARVK